MSRRQGYTRGAPTVADAARGVNLRLVKLLEAKEVGCNVLLEARYHSS